MKAILIITLFGAGGPAIESIPMVSMDACARAAVLVKRDLRPSGSGREIKTTCVKNEGFRLP